MAGSSSYLGGVGNYTGGLNNSSLATPKTDFGYSSQLYSNAGGYAGAGAAAAMPWVQAGSGILGTIMQGIGLYYQIKDAKAQRELMKTWRAEDIANNNAKFQEELAITKDKLLWDKGQAQRNWRWMEEDRNYNRVNSMVTNFMSLLQQQPVLEDRLMNIWRR